MRTFSPSRFTRFTLVFLAILANGGLGQTPSTVRHQPGKAPGRNEVYSMVVAPWTQEHQRHDHAQIFPLSEDRLMLVWSEYYVRNPERIFRTPYSPDGNTDQVPCQISGKISKDGGRTWSGRITLQENIGADNVKQPNLVRCMNGDILFFFTRWDFEKQERSIHYKRSSDEAATWSEVKQLSQPGGAYILDAGRVFMHSSGRIILPAYWSPEIWTEREKYEAFCFYSDDDGRTWRASRNRMQMPKRGAMEPTMVERKDGSILVYLRSTVGYLFEAESRDRGETWSQPRQTNLTSPQAEPLLRRIAGTDDLLLIWCNSLPYAMTHEGSKSFHRPRNPLSCAISRDEGRTWENVKNIENRPGYSSAYPNALFNEGEALITYYHTSDSTTADSELMLKIFPVQWFYEPAVLR